MRLFFKKNTVLSSNNLLSPSKTDTEPYMPNKPEIEYQDSHRCICAAHNCTVMKHPVLGDASITTSRSIHFASSSDSYLNENRLNTLRYRDMGRTEMKNIVSNPSPTKVLKIPSYKVSVPSNNEIMNKFNEEKIIHTANIKSEKQTNSVLQFLKQNTVTHLGSDSIKPSNTINETVNIETNGYCFQNDTSPVYQHQMQQHYNSMSYTMKTPIKSERSIKLSRSTTKHLDTGGSQTQWQRIADAYKKSPIYKLLSNITDFELTPKNSKKKLDQSYQSTTLQAFPLPQYTGVNCLSDNPLSDISDTSSDPFSSIELFFNLLEPRVLETNENNETSLIPMLPTIVGSEDGSNNMHSSLSSSIDSPICWDSKIRADNELLLTSRPVTRTRIQQITSSIACPGFESRAGADELRKALQLRRLRTNMDNDTI